MRKGYVDGPCGQIHYRSWAESTATQTPLLCLPPSPYSSVSYISLAPLLAANRQVIALDYPGYGGSDACPHEAGIADYADATASVATTLFPERAVDLLGFHTGCLVAAETSLAYPAGVNGLILIDVPYFEAESRPGLLKKTAVPTPLRAEMDMLAPAWEFSVTKRLDHMSLARAYTLFIDQASTGESMNAAFRAAFSYESDKRFIKVNKPTTVIATRSMLLEATRNAAGAIPGAELVEKLEVTAAVLESGAPHIASTVNAILHDRHQAPDS